MPDDLDLNVEPLGEMHLTLEPPVVIEGGPAGSRFIVEFSEVVIDGPRLKARSVGRTHGDWFTIGPDGTGCLDARFVLQTDDGVLIYAHGLGRNDAAGFMDGGVNLFSLSFEAGDPRYHWLHQAQILAKGRRRPDGTVQFRLFHVC